MSNPKSYVEIMGGPKRFALLVLGAVFAIVLIRWDGWRSADALEDIGSRLNLAFVKKGQRSEVSGVVDGVDVCIKTTTGNSGGDIRWFTDFELGAFDQPAARIQAVSIRQAVIDYAQGSEYVSTGDNDFDDAVLVSGDLEEMIARLDMDARFAVKEATHAGWELNNGIWKFRKSGRMTNAENIQAVLELGIAAAGALSLDVEVEDAIRRQAKNDPVHGVRVRAQALLGRSPAIATRQNFDDLLHAPYDASSLDAALLSAREGNAGESNRSRILSAVLANVRIEETIPALGKIGGLFEADMLSTIDDERQELAQKAIAEINHRLGSEN